MHEQAGDFVATKIPACSCITSQVPPWKDSFLAYLRPPACIVMAQDITPEELEEARRIFDPQAQRLLSESDPTHVHLIAPSQGHYAAVQLKLTPFQPPQFREQTLFYPHYRYTQCCQEISHHFYVETTIQMILRAFYQIGRWNLSDQAW